ncbi:MAG: PH domain-containing protein [Flavobacteriales bacterium]|nr:PH domain-containing protein [Flavobacteriales bacterium]
MNKSFEKFYRAKKGVFITLVVALLLIFPPILIYFDSQIPKVYIFLIVYYLPVSVLVWMYFDTSYRIKEKTFFYTCSFLKGEIAIDSIKELEIGVNMYSGIKPALAFKGIIIKYNKFDDIYIAPENNEELLNDLLAINPTIKINYGVGKNK